MYVRPEKKGEERGRSVAAGVGQRKKLATKGQKVRPLSAPWSSGDTSQLIIQRGRREAGYYGRDGTRKSQKVIRMEEFGDRNRVHNIDPNKIGERLTEDIKGMGIEDSDVDKKVGIWRPSKDEGTARPEDPPIYQPFRKAFHEAHNIKLSLERDWEGFAEADAEEGFTAKLLKLASTVKEVSKIYKSRVRNFQEEASVEDLKGIYFEVLEIGLDFAQDLTKRMLDAYVKAEAGEDELDEETLSGIKESKSEQGEEIWRHRWWAAVQKINGLLVDLWSKGKPQIEEWVAEKRDSLPYMDPGAVGDLDYIGSLAKGYKSAPKQWIRFMPEKFDVDANLDAPPLAVYAMSLGGTVDRGSVKSAAIEPLVEFESVVNNALFEFGNGLEDAPTAAKIPGLDKDDPFEVFIRASNVTDIMGGIHADVTHAHKKEAFSNRLQKIQDRIWWLRGKNTELTVRLGDLLTDKGFVTEQGTLKEHQPDVGKKHVKFRTYSEFDLTFLEATLKKFEAMSEQVDEDVPVEI